MAWTNSKIFSATMEDVLENTTAIDLNADTINVALFDNTVTPSQTVASANTAYGAGVWAAGGVGDAPSWPAVGRPLVTPGGPLRPDGPGSPPPRRAAPARPPWRPRAPPGGHGPAQERRSAAGEGGPGPGQPGGAAGRNK